LSTNTFAIQKTRGSWGRITAGAGLALAAIAMFGLGAGVAAAAPQQPVLVDDPAPPPPPAPAGMDPNMAVNIANGIFSQLSTLLDSIFPGSGALLMPASAATSGLAPGSGYPSAMPPGQTPGLPGYPNAMPPGQTPGLPGYPNAVPPGRATALPGNPPPGLTGPVSPVDTSPVV
jgi:hypothetical protein